MTENVTPICKKCGQPYDYDPNRTPWFYHTCVLPGLPGGPPTKATGGRDANG